MKSGDRPLPPRCALGPAISDKRSAEELTEHVWQERGFFGISLDDPRLRWMERKIIETIGTRIYGRLKG